MAKKEIQSPIFGIQPRKERRDLRLERIELMASKLFKRKNKKNDYETGRVVNLRQQKNTKPVLVRANNKVGVKRKENRPAPEKITFQPKVQIASLYKNFPQSRPIISEPLEISHPSREDILATLEAIEEVEQQLKDYDFSAEQIPILAELTEEIPAAPEEDLADFGKETFFDLEEYLGLKNEAPAEMLVVQTEPMPKLTPEPEFTEKQEENFLEYFLAKPQTITPAEVFSEVRAETIELIPSQLKKTFWSLKGETKKGKWQIKDLFRQGAGFVGAGFLIFLVIFGLSLTGQGLSAKDNILSSALQAYQAMLAAKNSASSFNFSAASVSFEEAYQNFLAAEQELNKMGRGLIYVLEKLPGGSLVESGAALVEVGEDLAKAGRSFSQIADLFLTQKLSDYFSDDSISLTQKIIQVQGEISAAQSALNSANTNLTKVETADLPADLAPAVNSLKEKLPFLAQGVTQLKSWSNIFLEVLGHERAKKYLLVFQNNSEARPTGGFIGTYGILDLDEGRIKNLFIDGIFNLDGQLYEKIVPPRPIQKISTAWSTHDANWFADWPASAKKIMMFYEKAGGESVDGVFSLTPTVVEKLLAIIGPIDLPQYNVSLNQDNFLDLTQYKVEVDYDKELNQPKKILADFTPVFLDRLWQVWPQRSQEIMGVLVDSLAQKHILFYFTNESLQKVFLEQGWGGEVLSTDKDYLAVVNTNINGFKTDRVVEQKIYHKAEVWGDGSIIDTVRIVRSHQGGQSQYDWYNKVNADYLRVYVPRGSKLISAKGQTLEAYNAPIDYQAQGFKGDAEVLMQEQGMVVDQSSGTQIFEESGKTVFGNWVYVSPGESVEIVYQYRLPFWLNLGADNFSWSFLAQKQSGSTGGQIESILIMPESYQINWQYPANLEINGSQIKFSDNLKIDKFYGIVFGR